MWSPYEIQVMLHHHASCDRFPRADAPAYAGCLKKLLDAGLLEYVGYVDGVPRSTERGQAFVRMLCDTPVPVVKYLDPRFPEGALASDLN